MATELARRVRGTRSHLGDKLRQQWLKATDTECEPLTFGDLKRGDRFILMPNPGDNSGHGGLLNGSYVFMKIGENNMYEYIMHDQAVKINAVRLTDGACLELRNDDFVIKVE